MPVDPKKLREEKEKEINAQYWELRKRSFRFLFLNVLLVLAFFAFIFYARQVTPQTYSSIVDSLQLTVELGKLEYFAPENIRAKVYLVNTSRRQRDFVITDFNIKVYNDERTVYDFSHASPVNGSVDALGRRLVFELGKDVSIAGMPSGQYKVQATCKLNGRQVSAVRTFQYTEEILNTVLLEPFYLIGEEISPSLLIINRTATQKSIGVAKIEWRVLGESFVQIIGQDYKLLPAESVTIRAQRGFAAKEKGNHELTCLVFFKDGRINETRIIAYVTDKFEESLSNIDVNLETEELVLASKPPRIRLTMTNSLNKQRFIKVDGASVSIPEIGYSFDIGARRISLVPFGRATLTLLERLKFERPGVYEVLVSVSTGGSTFTKKLKLAVAN